MLITMSYIQFKSYRNFYLHTDGWGVAQLNDIVVLLENVIKHFYSNLYRRRILSKQVFIKNSSNTIPPTNYPQIIKGRYYNTIYLSVKDRLCLNSHINFLMNCVIISLIVTFILRMISMVGLRRHCVSWLQFIV